MAKTATKSEKKSTKKGSSTSSAKKFGETYASIDAKNIISETSAPSKECQKSLRERKKDLSYSDTKRRPGVKERKPKEKKPKTERKKVSRDSKKDSDKK